MANVSVPACVEAVRQADKVGKVRILAHDISPEIRAFLKEGVVDFAIDQNLTYQIRHALELLFNAVAEATTTKLSQREKPEGFEESRKIAKKGGAATKRARQSIEEVIGEKIVSPLNASEKEKLVTEKLPEIPESTEPKE